MSGGFNAFPVLDSSATLRGPQFQANRKSWEPLIHKFESMSKDAMAEGEARHTDRHQSRGQLLGKTVVRKELRLGTPADQDCVASARSHLTAPRSRLAISRTLSFRWIRAERCTALWQFDLRCGKCLVGGRREIQTCHACRVFSSTLTEHCCCSGQPCLILSHIPTQNGGAWSTLTSES
jgi:hypothetical protein